MAGPLDMDVMPGIGVRKGHCVRHDTKDGTIFTMKVLELPDQVTAEQGGHEAQAGRSPQAWTGERREGVQSYPIERVH